MTKGEWNMSKTYTTTSGDMWDLIAKKTIGSEMLTDALIKANVGHRHTFIFPAGVVLTIPDIPVKTSSGLPPWKRGAAI
jgi:phage tail protein X